MHPATYFSFFTVNWVVILLLTPQHVHHYFNKFNPVHVIKWQTSCKVLHPVTLSNEQAKSTKKHKTLLCTTWESKLWLQCFHCRTDDERDTWSHDVGAKCRLSPLNLTDGYLQSLEDCCLHHCIFHFILKQTVVHKWELGHMFCVSLWYYIISLHVCLFHSGGLAERLNRLQCRQRSAISFWRHKSICDTSTAVTPTGDPHHTSPPNST